MPMRFIEISGIYSQVFIVVSSQETRTGATEIHQNLKFRVAGDMASGEHITHLSVLIVDCSMVLAAGGLGARGDGGRGGRCA